MWGIFEDFPAEHAHSLQGSLQVLFLQHHRFCSHKSLSYMQTIYSLHLHYPQHLLHPQIQVSIILQLRPARKTPTKLPLSQKHACRHNANIISSIHSRSCSIMHTNLGLKLVPLARKHGPYSCHFTWTDHHLHSHSPCRSPRTSAFRHGCISPQFQLKI